jgi:predicted HTH transcriptional regulator
MDQQFDMFKQVRRNDMNTSWLAAASIESLAQQHKAIVYRAIKRNGPMTSEEVADCCDLTFSQVWRRVSDLKRDGLIEDSGERRLNSSGRKAAGWHCREDG